MAARERTFTLEELARLCGAELAGDGALRISGLASLAEAGPSDVSFLANPRYRRDFELTRAGAVLVDRRAPIARTDLALLRCADPNRAWTAVIQAFAPAPAAVRAGVHPSASVDASAHVDPSAWVGPHCSIEAGARVGAQAVLHAHVAVGANARVGAHSVLHPNVVLYEGVEVGARCVVHAGAVLGSDGFGFERDASGWVKVPQCGTVVIEDEVEIGANCTIDRARFGATRIGRGAKLDNLVHVAHNVRVGARTLLIAQVGLAGSCNIGSDAIVAGQVGVVGHVTIGDRASVSAQSGVTGDVPAGAVYSGTPARPRMQSLRSQAQLSRVESLARRVEALERELARARGAAPLEQKHEQRAAGEQRTGTREEGR
jgi:UDP-3-O-[3-hydroxymyristoyl] glucosamine N-acyltransferase